MEERTVSRVEGWDAQPFPGGYGPLREMADAGFSGAVRTRSGTWAFLLNGRVLGVFEGTIEDFDAEEGTVHEAPHPSLPLLFTMQEIGGEQQAKYYTNDTPISEAHQQLSEASFTGFIELSENVLSGDYYVVYYGGRSMSCAFVGNAERLHTGEDAFERADDEVGIYEVRSVDIEVVDVPEPSTDSGGADQAESAPAEPSPADQQPDADDQADPAGQQPDAGDQGGSAGQRPGAGDQGQPAGQQPGAGDQGQPTGQQPDTGGQPTGQQPATGSQGQPTGRQGGADNQGQPAGQQPGAGDRGQQPGADDRGQQPGAGGQGRAGGRQPQGGSQGQPGGRQGDPQGQSGGRQGDPAGTGRPADPSERNARAGSATGSGGQANAPAESSGTRPRGGGTPQESAGGRSQERAGGAPQEPARDPGGSRSQRDQRGGAAESTGGAAGSAGGATGSGGGATAEVTPVPKERFETTQRVPSLDPDRTGVGDGGGSGVAGATTAETASDPGSPSAGRSQDAAGRRATDDRSPEAATGGAVRSTGEERTAGEGAVDAAVAQDADDGQLRAQLTEREQRIEELEAQLADLRVQRDGLRDERDELRDEVQRLEGKIDDLEAEIESLRSELHEGIEGKRRLDPEEALRGTNLFVRYGSKSGGTLEKAHAGDVGKEEVDTNLRLEHHTQFEADDVAVDGQPFREYLEGSLYHGFVDWIVRDLLYEIRETGHVKGLRDLYDALPKVDRAELLGEVTVEYVEDGEQYREQRTFDVVLRDRMGNPLVVADINDSRSPATHEMMTGVVDNASDVKESHDTLSSALLVTASFFEPGALEAADEVTGGGILGGSSKDSFVRLSRKVGYHLLLVETRDGEFHVNVPEL